MAVQISGNDITVPRDGSFTRNVTIGGTLTYEDVTNIDSVGLVTARSGIEVGARPGVAASISVDGNMIVSGISTFGGDVQVPDKIIHAGDTDTAIRFPAADVIAFETGNTERLRINSDGRIWVNTTSGSSATELLRVENTGSSSTDSRVSIISGTAAQAVLLFGDDQSYNQGQIVYANNDHSMRFHANAGNERLRIDSSGRLLLGTTTEGFDTYGDTLTLANSTHTGITIRSGTTSRGSIYFSDGTSGDAEYQGYVQYNHDDSRLVFGTAATERVRIFSNGDIGINATTINRSSTSRNTIQFDYSGSDASEGLEIRLSNSAINGNAATDNAAIVYVGQTLSFVNRESGHVKFFSNNTERLRITSGGDIGIGIDSPTRGPLHIHESSSNTTNIHLTNNDSGTTSQDGLTIFMDGNSSAGLWYRENAAFRIATNNSEKARITNDGILLVGTTSSSNSDNSLEVRNDSAGGALGVTSSNDSNQQDFILFKVGSGNAANGGIRRDGTTNGVELFSGSDRRIKTNIEKMDNVLDKINKLSLKKFDFKQGGSGVGLIAQELINIFPDKVKKDASDDGTGDTVPDGVEPWSIGHNFTYELLKSIQELSAENTALKARLDAAGL